MSIAKPNMAAQIKIGITTILTFGVLTGCDGGKFELGDNSARQMVEAPVLEEPCIDNNPLRNAYFGDVHVHTGYSADGWKYGVRTTPQDAYNYAFGGEIYLFPNDASGEKGTRPVRIDRPLDFMAVTDHAEFYGESRLCTDPQYPEFNGEYCTKFRTGYGRDFMQALGIISPIPFRPESLCGEDGAACKGAATTVWQDTIQAAEDWNDTSANCERATLVAYEYSSVRLGSNLHRNVIFRNTTVPAIPISTIEAPRDYQLWRALKKDCLESGTDCDVLAIPHNSNISNGRMFSIDYPGASGVEEQREIAALRMEIEPVVEVMQHKGDSECHNNVPGVIADYDALCENEKFEVFAFEKSSMLKRTFDEINECWESSLGDISLALGPTCLSRLSYVRHALVEGLKEEERIGVNPFKFGLSSSTDTHNGIGGGVTEKTFPGHLGTADDELRERASWTFEFDGNSSNSPGGLIGVWSPENSRAAIFDSIKSKEVFSTTGPRIQPRLFGGWSYDENLCGDPAMLVTAYADGVPMGQDLPAKAGVAPTFLATALADTGSSVQAGTPLQRLQIVKGWVDAEGQGREKVFDVAGDANNGASVNTDTCEQTGIGFNQLCTVWTDPEFNSSQRAVYYARAVENPSCRYATWQCSLASAEDRPESCDDPRNKVPLQERALTSPIWYTPQ